VWKDHKHRKFRRRLRRTREHALHAGDAIASHQISDQLHLIPKSETLADVGATHAHETDFAYALADMVAVRKEDHEVVLIDTPPGVGPLRTMALIASDRVIVPARPPADFDVGSAVKLADLIRADLVHANPNLQLLGVLLTQVDPRWIIGAQARDALQAAGIRRLATSIPFAVSIGAAPRHGEPTMVLRPDGLVACAYRRLAHDLVALLELG
jgi:chromosome partitioning protein